MTNIAIRRKRPGSRRGQAGVGLLEILVSILIFSFGVLGIIGLQARAISLSTDAEDRNRAALLANEAASMMWLSKSSTIAAAPLAAWKTMVADQALGGLPNGVGTVTVVAGTTREADIEITWRPPSRATGDSKLTTRVVIPDLP